MKREYSSTINLKYMSESMPIGESRHYFREEDTPYVERLRRIFRDKEGLTKKPIKKKRFGDESP